MFYVWNRFHFEHRNHAVNVIKRQRRVSYRYDGRHNTGGTATLRPPLSKNQCPQK